MGDRMTPYSVYHFFPRPLSGHEFTVDNYKQAVVVSEDVFTAHKALETVIGETEPLTAYYAVQQIGSAAFSIRPAVLMLSKEDKML